VETENEGSLTNIALTKVAAPSATTPGGTVTYTITVTNTSSVPASNVVVTDDFPSELTGIVAPTGCSLSGQTLTCTIPTLAAGASETFTVAATVSPTAVGPAIINCATAQTPTPETDYDDNGDCAEIMIGPAAPSTDVSIKKLGPPTAEPGGSVTYTYTVTNNSTTVAASDVVVGDVLPSELTDIMSSSPGCVIAAANVTCTIPTLAPGATETFTVTATVSPGGGGTSLDNCATVASSTPDSDLSNNESCDPIEVGEPATDIAVTKTGPATVQPGGIVTYTLTVANDSALPADGVILGDVFRPELTVTEVVPSGCSLASGTLTCTIGMLGPGETRTFTVTALVSPEVEPGTAIENCASAVTETEETDLTNDADCVQGLVPQVTPPPQVPVTG
jgi:uncharacterized repeat protein (TIGR01451 family)